MNRIIRAAAIHKSTDGGATWTEINEGLPPAQHRGRIGLDVCRSNPKVVYAFVDNYEPDAARRLTNGTLTAGLARAGIKGAEIYRSDDKGQTVAKGQRIEPLQAIVRDVRLGVRTDSRGSRTTRTRST